MPQPPKAAADGGLDVPPALAKPPGEKTWKVGTLLYNPRTLTMVFIWMIWGDIVFCLVEKIFPVSMPLQLDRLGFNKLEITILFTTLSQVIHLPFTPYLSVKSDRTRSRFGRRIPYIVVILIPLSICMAALGFSDEIGEYVKNAAWVAHTGIPAHTLLFFILAILIVLFDFTNAFINTVWYYLGADVIPKEIFARYTSIMRVAGMAAGSVYSFFVQRHIEIHTKYVYLGAAALCLFGFALMCWKVKEGEYPPPKSQDSSDAWYVRKWQGIKLYFTESFRHPLFICFYVSNTTLQMSNGCMFCSIFYYRKYLHLSQAQMGAFTGSFVWVSIAMAFPLGWFVDKIHPMRATLLGMAVVIIMSFSGFWMESFVMWMAWFIMRAPFMQMLDAASGPLAVSIFPRKQYGQFASANATVRGATMLLVNLLAAWFMNAVTDRSMGPSGNRFLFIWLAVFQALAFGCMFVTYIYWKAHGGEKFIYDPDRPFSAQLTEDAPVSAPASPRPVLAGSSQDPSSKK